MDIIENRYKMIIESERSGKKHFRDLYCVWSFKTNMVQMEKTL